MLLGILCGMSLEENPLLPLLLPTSLKVTCPRPLSTRRALQPCNSRSSRNDFSFSSRSSRSARRTCNCVSVSLCWSSSIFRSKRSILSRALLTSSVSCALTLSLRSIWDWRSLTVRSTFREERCSELCLASCSSRWVSNWKHSSLAHGHYSKATKSGEPTSLILLCRNFISWLPEE